MYDEERAAAEIRGLSTEARLHLKHLWRNFLQIITASAELGLSADGLPPPAYENLSHIKDAVMEHEKSLMELRI
ncbi:MAG: hypothetical protein ACE5EB_08250 [Thermodesulfobacteriota bacterium]